MPVILPLVSRVFSNINAVKLYGQLLIRNPSIQCLTTIGQTTLPHLLQSMPYYSDACKRKEGCNWVLQHPRMRQQATDYRQISELCYQGNMRIQCGPSISTMPPCHNYHWGSKSKKKKRRKSKCKKKRKSRKGKKYKKKKRCPKKCKPNIAPFTPPECCPPPCPKDPRFDAIYYQPSEKATREYQVTWVECPFKRPSKRTCLPDMKNLPLPPIYKRVPQKCVPKQQKCKAEVSENTNTLCKLMTDKNFKCRKITMPCCKPVYVGMYKCTYRERIKCKKQKAPYPSYSECCKPPLRKKRPDECTCNDALKLCYLMRYLKLRQGWRRHKKY